MSRITMLEPRPNLARVEGPSVSLVLDDAISQETRLFRVSLGSFRGDLKRGFLNGYPGAVASGGELQLTFDSVEPRYERVNGKCVARLRYRGRLLDGREQVMAFAGVSKSEPGDFANCFKSAIETMYEQTWGVLHGRSAGPEIPWD